MKHTLANIPVTDRFPGFHGRFVHSDTMTFAYWDVEEGAALPPHSHPHEQVVNMLDGTFELVVNGQPTVLRTGDVYAIPGNAPHAGRAVTACRILDVFSPVREDYR